MRIAILGCGPAGLVSAWAAVRAGHDVTIFSKARQSEMFGAQYLHEPIPGVPPGPSQELKYELRGSAEQYRRKVYGASYNGPVSPESLLGDQIVFNIRTTYNWLWAIYGRYINDQIVTPSWLRENVRKFDKVFSTIPLPMICCLQGWHVFYSQPIWAAGDAPERGRSLDTDIKDGTIICNGETYPTWYRASRIYGYATLEWSKFPGSTRPNLNVAEVRKPVSNNCSCWPTVTRVGRYGSWTKGVLVHQAYEQVTKCLRPTDR